MAYYESQGFHPFTVNGEDAKCTISEMDLDYKKIILSGPNFRAE
jgi:hypothetical protein